MPALSPLKISWSQLTQIFQGPPEDAVLYCRVSDYPETSKYSPEPVPPKEPRAFLSVEPSHKEFLDTIAAGEGTTDAKARASGYASGYDVPLGYGAYGDSPKPLSQMTLAEVDQFQTSLLANPENKFRSSAVGRYQITRTNLRELKEKWKISDDTVFDANLQDALGLAILKKRKLDSLIAGDITTIQFQNNLSNEWVSIAPHGDGPSTSGQPVATHTTEIQSAINKLLK